MEWRAWRPAILFYLNNREYYLTTVHVAIFSAMKKKTLITLMLLGSLGASAQIDIGPDTRSGKISDEYLAALKKTTTLFVLQEKDFENLPAWEEAVSSVWNITQHKFIHADEITDYAKKKGYSFFAFEEDIHSHHHASQTNSVQSMGMNGRMTTTVTSITPASSHASSVDIIYSLYIPGYDKKGELKTRNNGEMKDRDFYANIMMYPDRDAMVQATNMADRHVVNGFSRKKFNRKFDDLVYNHAVIYNWTPGMMKGFLSVTNKSLKEKISLDRDDEYEAEGMLRRLQRDTLYVPTYVNKKVNMFTGAEKEVERDDDELKSIYQYPVKFVDINELDKLIADKNRNILYLSVAISSARKYVNVYQSKTGGLVYAEYTKGSLSFKNKDLSKLAKRISKSSS